MPKPKITEIRRRLKVFRLKVFRLKSFPVKSLATRAQNGQLLTGILSTDKVSPTGGSSGFSTHSHVVKTVLKTFKCTNF